MNPGPPGPVLPPWDGFKARLEKGHLHLGGTVSMRGLLRVSRGLAVMKCSQPQHGWRGDPGLQGAVPRGRGSAPQLLPSGHTAPWAGRGAGGMSGCLRRCCPLPRPGTPREGQVALRWCLAPAGEGSASPGGLSIAPKAGLGSQIKIEGETGAQLSRPLLLPPRPASAPTPAPLSATAPSPCHPRGPWGGRRRRQRG